MRYGNGLRWRNGGSEAALLCLSEREKGKSSSQTLEKAIWLKYMFLINLYKM